MKDQTHPVNTTRTLVHCSLFTRKHEMYIGHIDLIISIKRNKVLGMSLIG